MSPSTKKKTTTRTTHTRAESDSGMRSKFSDLPPLDGLANTKKAIDPELEEHIFALVTAVGENEGMTYPPAWTPIADAAKRLGYLRESNLQLFLKDHGRQWLTARAQPRSGELGGSGTVVYTMTKIDPKSRLRLKDLAHDTGVPMQEALGMIISAIHENRDELTRAARAAGEEHPWEAISALLRARRSS